MATITLYSDKVTIEPANKTQFDVTLENIDASDFVLEFTVDEILSAMDFNDVYDWAIKMKGEDDCED